MIDKEEFLEIGTLGKTKGLKGEIFFYPHNEETLNPLSESSVRLNTKPPKNLIIESHKVKTPAKRILKFKDLGKIEDVESFVNAKLFALRESMPELEEDEYYLEDLVGFKLLDMEGNEIGTVKAFYFNNAHDVLILENGSKFGLDIPFV